jgi:hypothetical protein
MVIVLRMRLPTLQPSLTLALLPLFVPTNVSGLVSNFPTMPICEPKHPDDYPDRQKKQNQHLNRSHSSLPDRQYGFVSAFSLLMKSGVVNSTLQRPILVLFCLRMTTAPSGIFH